MGSKRKVARVNNVVAAAAAASLLIAAVLLFIRLLSLLGPSTARRSPDEARWRAGTQRFQPAPSRSGRQVFGGGEARLSAKRDVSAGRTAALIVGFLLVAGVAFVTIGYPFLFRESLAEPVLEVDPAEGKVRLDAEMVLEFRGDLSKEAVQQSLTLSPAVPLGAEDLRVEHTARLPWHRGLPWARTRVTINPEGEELFEPETRYTMALMGEHLTFETITLPRVVGTTPRDGTEGVDVWSPVRILFNERVNWDDSTLVIEPPAATVVVDRGWSENAVSVTPVERPWEPSTRYTLRIAAGVEDLYGHAMREEFVTSFVTKAPVSVTGASPIGMSQALGSSASIVFDSAPIRQVAEDSFAVRPATEGQLTWENDTTLVWSPESLEHSTSYEFSMGGSNSWLYPIAQYGWQFRTTDPPVTVELQGGSRSPATLTAVASGGIGTYSYEWSTGATGDSAAVDVAPGSSLNVTVTVASGDQTATVSTVVPGPSLGTAFVRQASVTPGGGSKIVLTFDDTGAMGEILDILARYDAKAVFFPWGRWANSVPHLIQRAGDEGHPVCNHTYSHANLAALAAPAIRSEIAGGAVGSCNLLRPPYAGLNSLVNSIAAEMGYEIYMWDIDSRDWARPYAGGDREILNTVLAQAFPGAVVLMHMYAPGTLAALPAMIERLQDAGYVVGW
jgi:peptidoglycan/xylan/chitin deacetylase (PgdA/CDA1 family)